jgi:hypothetical protein
LKAIDGGLSITAENAVSAGLADAEAEPNEAALDGEDGGHKRLR